MLKLKTFTKQASHSDSRLKFIAGQPCDMEQQALTPKDLKPMIGQRHRVYEVLNRTRPLTLNMIRRLHTGLGIPAESRIKPSVNTQALQSHTIHVLHEALHGRRLGIGLRRTQ